MAVVSWLFPSVATQSETYNVIPVKDSEVLAWRALRQICVQRQVRNVMQPEHQRNVLHSFSLVSHAIPTS